jgi:hypothetical protein
LMERSDVRRYQAAIPLADSRSISGPLVTPLLKTSTRPAMHPSNDAPAEKEAERPASSKATRTIITPAR